MRSDAPALLPILRSRHLVGPHFVIAEEFGSLDAIAVAIYGSWAARYEGVEGHPPHDVDVLVIGEVPRRDIYEAAERAEQRAGLPVNPVEPSDG
jgi:hypothetical protein